MEEDGFSEDEIATPKKGLIANLFDGNGSNREKWLNVILAIVILEYLRLLYIDIKSLGYVLSGQGYPFRMVYFGSYADLLYLPIVYYIFYKRRRWGWIALFVVKLITIEPTLLYYFNDYLPTSGADIFPYFLLTIPINIFILLYLWKPAVSSIFKVNDKIKWLTLLSVVLILALLTIFGNHNYPPDRNSITENLTKTAGKDQEDTTGKPRPKLLALIKATGRKPVDTTYMRTGFYFLAEKSEGIDMRLENSNEIYTLSRLPFASVKNVSEANLEKSHLDGKDYMELIMTLDKKGTNDLEKGTGNPLHPKIAVVVANRLLYVLENATSVKSGIMSVLLDGYSGQEMEAMLDSVKNKR